jgi:hypothetical protein
VRKRQQRSVTESVEFHAVSDEFRWCSLSEGECQRFVSSEDGILNEFEMMWQFGNVFNSPCILLFLSRLCVTWQLRQMWSKFSHGWDEFQKLILTQTPSLTWFRHGPQAHVQTLCVKDIMDKYYEIFRGKNSANKKDIFHCPDNPEHSYQDSDTDG